MKTFILIYHGYAAKTLDTVEDWNDWVSRRAPSFTDVGGSFGPGRTITMDRTIELSLSSNAASGYSIVAAEHIDAAEQLLEGCPIVDSVSLYEIRDREQPKGTTNEERNDT